MYPIVQDPGPTRNLKLVTTAALAACLSLGAAALAQRPLTSPTYLLSTIPVLELDVFASGELTEQDGQNFKDGSRVNLWAFDGREGDSIGIILSSNDFDTYLTVYTPQGELLTWNDDDWSGMSEAVWSSVAYAWLPVDGRYLVVVSGYADYDLGEYNLVYFMDEWPEAEVRNLDDAVELSLPAHVHGDLTPGRPLTGEYYAGPSDAYSFTLADTRLVTLRMASDIVDTVLILYDAAGNLIGLNDDYYVYEGPDSPWYSTDTFLAVELPAGTYFVVAGSYSDWDEGEYELSIRTYIDAD